MTKIKICGMKRECDILWANELKVDFVGFILASGFARSIDFDTAKMLKQKLSKDILSVGVFVNNDIDFVLEFVNSEIIDIIQLHGDEDNNYIQNLKKLTNKTVIKVFKVNSNTDFEKIEKTLADYVLFDSGCGSGEVFDWDILKGYKKPYFLAGGLNKQNVQFAVSRLSPFAVDVSSGVETNGFKDKEKMTDFVNEIRRHEKEVL